MTTKNSNKVRIVIFFIALGFAIYFGVSMVGSIGEYQSAQKEVDVAEQELAQAEQELDEAIKKVREVS